jgi:hypothetical protein
MCEISHTDSGRSGRIIARGNSMRATEIAATRLAIPRQSLPRIVKGGGGMTYDIPAV